MATESAKVTITGTPEKPVFNFVIPSGAKGERGVQGDKGNTGPTPALKVGVVNTTTHPSDEEWIAGMIRKSPAVTSALSETFPSTMRGEKGEKGDGGMPVGVIAADLNNYLSDGYYKMEAGASDLKNLPPTLTQKYGTLAVLTTNGSNRLEQIFYPTATSQGGKVFFLRALAGNVWSPWRTISTQRMDISAGKALYTWDDNTNTEQLIWGDTGLRDISSLLVGAGMTAANGVPTIRRVGSTVTLNLNGISPLTTLAEAPGYLEFFTLPTGFRYVFQNLNIYATVQSTPIVKSLQVVSRDKLRLYQFPNVNDQIRETIIFDTNDPWPTTLPGTAVG